ncbi:MAG: hypothetical protein MZW92_64095 [Comamonadaceae bacterium]|nr:hypothetical protein [Comamonadaceae bacterium]
MYTLVGFIAAALGAVLVQTGIIGKAQGILQIIAGVVVILLGLETMGLVAVAAHDELRQGFMAAQAAVRRAEEGCGRRRRHRRCGERPDALFHDDGDGGEGHHRRHAAGRRPAAARLRRRHIALDAVRQPDLRASSATEVRGMLLKSAAVIVIALGLATVYQGVAYYGIMSKLGNW